MAIENERTRITKKTDGSVTVIETHQTGLGPRVGYAAGLSETMVQNAYKEAAERNVDPDQVLKEYARMLADL